MITGYTLDTGALIALERRHQRMAVFWELARVEHLPITVPAVVVAEWWRAESAVRTAILRAVTVEPLTRELAQLAGKAIGAVRGSTVADAIVVASAAQRGDAILTSDVDDMEALREHFRSVAVVLRV